MSNAFSHISNPGLLTPETPGTATLKFSRTNPRRPPEGLATVAPKAVRPWPEGLTTVAQRTTIIITPSTTQRITPARESAESTEFRV